MRAFVSSVLVITKGVGLYRSLVRSAFDTCGRKSAYIVVDSDFSHLREAGDHNGIGHAVNRDCAGGRQVVLIDVPQIIRFRPLHENLFFIKVHYAASTCREGPVVFC
ncbi:hypothetical protein BJ878DRAFT_514819 [Calycina marina]|uniref:Uncharacterized protein n=1 Tax=Calycina marina TaxID=1763456 RepID=A0A9P7YZ07_9HELO|nr:hypothetical protein BJ878DRAFT_514819 [Calycina marina]